MTKLDYHAIAAVLNVVAAILFTISAYMYRRLKKRLVKTYHDLLPTTADYNKVDWISIYMSTNSIGKKRFSGSIEYIYDNKQTLKYNVPDGVSLYDIVYQINTIINEKIPPFIIGSEPN